MADYLEKKYFHRYGFSEEDDPLAEDDLELFIEEKEYELVNQMLDDENSRLHKFFINNPRYVEEEEFETNYKVLNEDGEIEKLGFLISWGEPNIQHRKSQYSTDPETPLYRFEFLNAEEVPLALKIPRRVICDWCEDTIQKSPMLVPSMSDKLALVCSQECADDISGLSDQDANESIKQDFERTINVEKYQSEETPSAYWFLKTEIANRAPLNKMDLEQILEMLQNVPAKEMNEAMEQAEMFGDEAALIVLVMADNKRKFREEYASEDEPSVEKLKSYFSRLKSQNPDLARKIEFSVKNEEELPTEEIEKAGFQEDKIEEWVDLVGVEDENLQPYESCPTCEGEGIIITNYYPATRYDPADADFEECEDCYGSGEIDPAYYMDKDGNYMAETFEAYNPPLEEITASCDNCGKSFPAKVGRGTGQADSRVYFGNGKEIGWVSRNTRTGEPILSCEECWETMSIYEWNPPTSLFDSENERKCAICNAPSKFTVMTAIGERSFCCEACYADYMGLPIEEEGYYGLASESWQGKSLAGSLEEMDEMLGRKKAESHADRQLEESIKRTKLSAIRTGLAITTFGIVMLNLWINRKQSQQIDNLNKKD